MKTTTILLLLLGLIPGVSRAQDSTKKYPAIVLVQLRSEHNRIVALTKDRQYDALEEVIHDANEVTARMKLDFHTFFDYCPVYYYVDTNADLIRAKKFDGIVFNEDGTKATNLPLNSSSTDYVIAYYGFPVSQSRADKVQTDSVRDKYDPQSPNVRGLVILNDKFQQLTYFYKIGYDEFFFRNKKYVYKSKRFEIEYYPLANLFNRTRLNPYGTRRIHPEKED